MGDEHDHGGVQSGEMPRGAAGVQALALMSRRSGFGMAIRTHRKTDAAGVLRCLRRAPG